MRTKAYHRSAMVGRKLAPAGHRFGDRRRCFVRFVAIMALLALAGCAGETVPKAEPSFYRNLAQPGAQLDADAAASMISGYRTNQRAGGGDARSPS